MNPEEETEAAHFELWESELPTLPTAIIEFEISRPSVWVRLGEMVAFLSVWAVILGVGISVWVGVIALILWLIP